MHPRRDALGIERRDRLVVDQNVLAARLVLELRDVGDQRRLCERNAPLWRARRHERLADEDLARDRGIDRAERNRPARDEREPVELHALARDHFAAPSSQCGSK